MPVTGLALVVRSGGEQLLDREARAEYRYELVASDAGGQSARIPLRVLVADINDHSPRFTSTLYNGAHSTVYCLVSTV